MAIDAGKIQGFLDLDITGFVDALNEATSAANSKLSNIETNAESKTSAISSKLATVGTILTAGVTAPILGAGTAAVKTAIEWETAGSKLQSTLGLTTEETEKFTTVARNVYKNGFGESFDAIVENLQVVGQNIRGLSDDDLQYVTTGVTNLADTMDMDVSESIRGVKALMQGFGLTAQEAMDMLAAGAQNGLNYSDELGDNLAEYGPRLASMGMSASQYFQILENGTKNGAYNLDKCNDFLNEFMTAMSDGRIEENIGSFSDGTKQLFQDWKDGNATMADVYNSLMQDFSGMQNGYDKQVLASAIWSSLGEDNAMSMIDAMQSVGDTFDNVSGKSQEMADIASENLGSKWSSIVRTFQDGLGQLGESGTGPLNTILDLLQQLANWFDNMSPEMQQIVVIIAGIVAAIGPLLIIVAQVITAVTTISGVLGPVIAVLTGPAGIVIAIAAVVAAIVSFLATNEEARNKISEVWNSIKEFFSTVFEAIKLLFTVTWLVIQTTVSDVIDDIKNTIENVFNAIASFIQGIWDGICTTTTSVWDAIRSAVDSAINAVKSVIDSIFNAISSTISSAWESAKSLTSSAWDAMKNAVSSGINGVLNFVSNLPNNILSALGNVGSLLWNAGSSIINGLLNGIKSAIGGVYSFVSGIAGKIASLKGPEKKDRKLLVPNGGWIISGLDEGLEESFENTEEKVAGFAGRLKDAFSSVKTKAEVAFQASKEAFTPTFNIEQTVSSSGLIDYDMLAAKMAAVLKDAPINPQVEVQMGDGNVYLDKERVGRNIAPVISRVMTKKVVASV